MKYPKLWNGTSPVGEALERALRRANAPFLSSSTADGVRADKAGKFSAVYQEGAAGGFISRPTWGAYDAPQFYATGAGPFMQMNPQLKPGMRKALPTYGKRFGLPQNYGMVDWQGSTPDKVLSWKAWSWVGDPLYRYDPFTEDRLNRGFYDVTKSNVFFLQGNNFSDLTWAGARRPFDTPTLRYQCVGDGLQVYRGMKLWRELREDQRISEFEFIQGAAISAYGDRSGCFVILREVDVPNTLGIFDREVRAGWLNAEGTFDETHRTTIGTSSVVGAQCWYFDRKGQRALFVDSDGATYEFTHALGFRLIEPFVANAWFSLGRDFFGDEIVSLDRRDTPNPNYDFVGRTVRKNEVGEYAPVEWSVPAMRWNFDGSNWPHFTARALGCDLRAGALLLIEHTFSPDEGSYYAPFVDDPELSIAGTNKSVVLTADVALYLHGEEVYRQPIQVAV